MSLQEDLAIIRSTLLPLTQHHQQPTPGTAMAALSNMHQQQHNQAHKHLPSYQQPSSGSVDVSAAVLASSKTAPCRNPAQPTNIYHSPSKGTSHMQHVTTSPGKTMQNGHGPSEARQHDNLGAACDDLAGLNAHTHNSGIPGHYNQSGPKSRHRDHGRHATAGHRPPETPSSKLCRAGVDCCGSPASSGSLAGMVVALQTDVDKLQAQLHSSRRQLKYGGHVQHNDEDDDAACISSSHHASR